MFGEQCDQLPGPKCLGDHPGWQVADAQTLQYRPSNAVQAVEANTTADLDAQTVNKQGCLYYIASQDVKHPNVFQLTEGWASQADMDVHVASPEFKQMLEQAFKLRILRREIYISESKGRRLMA